MMQLLDAAICLHLNFSIEYRLVGFLRQPRADLLVETVDRKKHNTW